MLIWNATFLTQTVFEELHIGAHFRDLLYVHHNEAFHLRVLLLIKPGVGERHVCDWLQRAEACKNSMGMEKVNESCGVSLVARLECEIYR